MPTQKQQNTIKEMAKKKLLTADQKKVLYKLFERKIDNKSQEAHRKITEEKDRLVSRLLKEGEKDQKIKDIRRKIDQCEIDKERFEKKLNELGYDLTYHNKLNIHGHKEVEKICDRNEKKLEEIDELKYKLLSDIYGLPYTYEEMNDYISKEIEKIERKI